MSCWAWSLPSIYRTLPPAQRNEIRVIDGNRQLFSNSRRAPVPVLIPAHNEESVIGRCLHALLEHAESDEFRVIVVANGCSDNTGEVARRFGVEVLETPVASKTAALNLGEKQVSEEDFPRLYLDADLVLSTESARAMCNALHESEALAVAPKFEFDFAGCSWAVRAYYRVWERMSYFDAGRIAGAYALSKEGRERFGEFPELISDDGYVRMHFAPAERRTLQKHVVVLSVPRHLRDLLRIKIRSKFGTSELRDKHPHLFANENADSSLSALRMLTNPRLWRFGWVYMLVNLAAHQQARRRRYNKNLVWERDTSSRVRLTHSTQNERD